MQELLLSLFSIIYFLIFDQNHKMDNEQDLYLQDFYSLKGVINRSNYRLLSLLYFGLSIMTYLLPGLIAALLSSSKYAPPNKFYDILDIITRPTWLIFGGTLLISYLILTIKRMRDTGHSTWKVLIPFENIRLLFFCKSS